MADTDYDKFTVTSTLVYVTVIAIDNELKKVWLNKSRGEGDLGEWSNFGGSAKGDLYEEAVKMLAPYELWAQSLSLINDHASVGYETDSPDHAVIRRYVTFAAPIYTPYNDEHIAKDGDTILQAFSMAELYELNEAGELIPEAEHFLPEKVRDYLNGVGKL